MVLVGYMDESYSGEKPPLTFGISCLFAFGNEWAWMEMAWKKVLEEKNAELLLHGRPPLNRFHTADLNSLSDEFEGWTPDERTAFVSKCIKKVFGQHESYCTAYTISLRDVAEVWPEYSKNTFGFAYYTILKILMLDLGKIIRDYFVTGSKITLIHDRCAFDGTLLESFNSVVNDPKFAYKDIFTTIAPMGWEDCVPVQLADFTAYEVMKETHRLMPEVMSKKARPRRLSLASLLARESFLGQAQHIPRESIVSIRESITARAKAIIVTESESVP